MTPLHRVSPVAASAALVEVVHGPRQRAVVAVAGRRGAVVQLDGGSIVVFERPNGPRLPVSIVVTADDLPRSGWVGAIGAGVIELGPVIWRPRRWWDPRPSPLPADLSAADLDRLARSLPPLPRTADAFFDAVDPVGFGEGSTPAGDDWLAARLATLIAIGATDRAAALWKRIEPQVGGTTPLSAALLRQASRGHAAVPVIELLAAIGRGVGIEAAARKLMAVGGSSGTWMAHGVLNALTPAMAGVGSAPGG